MATKKSKVVFLRPITANSMLKGAGCFAIRGGSAIGAGALSNAASNIAPKAHGPIAMALGLAADMFIENDYARAPFEGIGAWGAIKTADTFVPAGSNLRRHLGLGNTDANTDTTVVNSTPDWDAIAAELNVEESIEGLEEEAPEFTDEDVEAAMRDFNDASSEMETLETLPI